MPARECHAWKRPCDSPCVGCHGVSLGGGQEWGMFVCAHPLLQSLTDASEPWDHSTHTTTCLCPPPPVFDRERPQSPGIKARDWKASHMAPSQTERPLTGMEAVTSVL